MGKGLAHRFRDETKLLIDWQIVRERDSTAERFIKRCQVEAMGTAL